MWRSEVWRFDGGTTWTQVNDDHFGDGSNNTVGSMIVFGDHLYVATENENNGFQVWRTSLIFMGGFESGNTNKWSAVQN